MIRLLTSLPTRQLIDAHSKADKNNSKNKTVKTGAQLLANQIRLFSEHGVNVANFL